MFFIIFQGLPVGKLFRRPETAPLTILSIKRGLSCNFVKALKYGHFMGHNEMGIKFSINICRFPKLSSHSLLKSMSKMIILDLNKRGIFFKFFLENEISF